MNSTFSPLIWNYIGALPTIIGLALCCAAVLGNFHRARKASMWALAGFGMLLTLALFGPSIFTLISTQVRSSGNSADSSLYFAAYRIVDGILRVGAYACLVVAVFAGRSYETEQASKNV